MGMFDHINYEAKCENCGAELKHFQSKDGPCELKHLPPDAVDYFYTSCDECKTWHDFKVHRVCIVKQIDVTTRKRS